MLIYGYVAVKLLIKFIKLIFIVLIEFLDLRICFPELPVLRPVNKLEFWLYHKLYYKSKSQFVHEVLLRLSGGSFKAMNNLLFLEFHEIYE